jgi:hypothetical protein
LLDAVRASYLVVMRNLILVAEATSGGVVTLKK